MNARPTHSSGSFPRPRLLLLSDRFLPHAGGSRVYYYNLYSRLAANGTADVTVLTKKVPGWKAFDAAHARQFGNMRIVRRFRPLPNLRLQHLPRLVPPLLQSLAYATRHPLSAVHAGDLYPGGVIALLLKRIFGLPYVAYCHGEDITLTEERRFQRPMRDKIYREADAVVAACSFARQQILRIGVPPDKVHLLTPGVELERFEPRPPSPELARRLGVEGRRVLLTVARLTPRKGHAAVLDAFARILPEFPDAVYVIAGTGPEQKALAALAARLGIAHAVRFTGYVPESDLPDLYRLCELFVMMNHEVDGDIEGFGMVFLEANAAGKPVLGGASGGTFDAVVEGETGFLLDPEDTAGLAARLRLLLRDDALRARLGARGRERACAEFGWESRAAQLGRITEALAETEVSRRRGTGVAAPFGHPVQPGVASLALGQEAVPKVPR